MRELSRRGLVSRAAALVVCSVGAGGALEGTARGQEGDPAAKETLCRREVLQESKDLSDSIVKAFEEQKRATIAESEKEAAQRGFYNAMVTNLSKFYEFVD